MNIELEQGSVILFPDENNNGYFTTVTLVLSTIGVFLSLCALLLLIITACLFREWRDSYKNQLLIQFMLARCLYTFVRYYFDVRRTYNICSGHACVIYLDEVTMIYTEIVHVEWMFIFSRQMYDSLVKVFCPTNPNIWKVSVLAWAIPIVISILMWGFYEWHSGNDLKVFFLYLAVIKWPLLIANATMLLMILRSLTKDNKTHVYSPSNNTRIVVVMNLLIFFFCFQQAFVDIFKIVYVIFNLSSGMLRAINITTMFHCGIAIIFWVFGNEKTRKLWRNKIRCSNKIPLRQQSSLGIPNNSKC